MNEMNAMNEQDLEKLLTDAHKSKSVLAGLSSGIKNGVLQRMADNLLEDRKSILEENEKDRKKAGEQKVSAAFLDRLSLDEKRISRMAQGLREIALLKDPVGEIVSGNTRPNGLRIRQVRVPLGVILVIYEARPDVTADAAGLCFKAGNACILRGGSESFASNQAVVRSVQRALKQFNLPHEAVTFIPSTEREILLKLVKYDKYIDLVIPRGGEGLIRMIVEESRLPVVFHAKGVCHVFVDASADRETAERIVINAKTQRPGVCNAMETLLLHKEYGYAKELIGKLIGKKVEIRGDKSLQALDKNVKSMDGNDWDTEYLDLILSARQVDSLEEAVSHINRYGTHLSDAIVTADYRSAERFLREVDSATVYVNASTRFTDGGEFGLGAEIGISTQKLHCRGPMGLKELTSTKYVIYGEGQIRE